MPSSPHHIFRAPPPPPASPRCILMCSAPTSSHTASGLGLSLTSLSASPPLSPPSPPRLAPPRLPQPPPFVSSRGAQPSASACPCALPSSLLLPATPSLGTLTSVLLFSSTSPLPLSGSPLRMLAAMVVSSRRAAAQFKGRCSCFRSAAEARVPSPFSSLPWVSAQPSWAHYGPAPSPLSSSFLLTSSPPRAAHPDSWVGVVEALLMGGSSCSLWRAPFLCACGYSTSSWSSTSLLLYWGDRARCSPQSLS
mmetsp:Transcript_69323/g.137455  ORF Transcript_69323/g.137455 Transcript_69323/m.137455 type:complete len:251 (-) Transcript_69323:1131-1883(-)